MDGLLVIWLVVDLVIWLIVFYNTSTLLTNYKLLTINYQLSTPLYLCIAFSKASNPASMNISETVGCA